MTQRYSSEDGDRHIRPVVEQLMARYRWQLLTADDLVQRTAQHLHAGIAQHIPHAAIAAYCVAMHRACAGVEGPLRQNLAFTELASYLHAMVSSRFRDLGKEAREDATQSALERIFRSIHTCREPLAFLAFAAQHLLNAVRMVRRAEHVPTQPLEQRIPDQEDAPELALPDWQMEPSKVILSNERRNAIRQLVDEFAQAHPRASTQVSVLRLWLDDLEDKEIGQQLNISPGNVYTTRHRALREIATDPQWRVRAMFLGVSGDEL